MEKINWQNGTLIKEAFIEIDGTEYLVTPRQVEGTTPLSADNLNLMQNNIENAIEDAVDGLNYEYITETGETNGWVWRKWKSGRVEMSKYVYYTGLNITTSSAGTYYGASKTENLPFKLNDWYFVATSEGGTMSSGVYVYRKTISNDGLTITADFRAHASSSNANCGVTYYIIGQI